jgi:hypothetical protein
MAVDRSTGRQGRTSSVNGRLGRSFRDIDLPNARVADGSATAGTTQTDEHVSARFAQLRSAARSSRKIPQVRYVSRLMSR